MACPIGFQRRQSARQSSLGLAHRQHEWQLFDQRCSALATSSWSNHSILAWHVDTGSTRPGGDGRRYDSSNESEISPEVHRRQRAGLHKPCPSSTRVATACSSLQCSCSSSWSSRTISAWSVGTARLDWMGTNGQVIRPTNRVQVHGTFNGDCAQDCTSLAHHLHEWQQSDQHRRRLCGSIWSTRSSLSLVSWHSHGLIGGGSWPGYLPLSS